MYHFFSLCLRHLGSKKTGVNKFLRGFYDNLNQILFCRFIENLYKQYVDLYFTYLEINPLVITDGKVAFKG